MAEEIGGGRSGKGVDVSEKRLTRAYWELWMRHRRLDFATWEM